MKILFVAFSASIHTVRWLSQIANRDWQIDVYPSIDFGFDHKDIGNARIYHLFYSGDCAGKNTVRYGIKLKSLKVSSTLNYYCNRVFPEYRINRLVRLISKLNPDIIHSLETQSAGYLVMEAKKIYKGKFPTWIHTNWGSDIYLYGRIKEHEPKIREVLENCDYYSCECQRDVSLAKQFGLKGKLLPVFPNAGGFDLEKTTQLKSPNKTSERRCIIIKGYQGWAGRALVTLRALELCAGMLKKYEICIYSGNSDEVKIKAKLLQSAGMKVSIVPDKTPHEDILKLFGSARIYIGLSISDAISTSLLESMVMGSFPIQSWTSCADEWIEDGVSGFLVPPEDPEKVAEAIKKALEDDDLVNSASDKNWDVAKERLDIKVIKQQAISIYEKIYSGE